MASMRHFAPWEDSLCGGQGSRLILTPGGPHQWPPLGSRWGGPPGVILNETPTCVWTSLSAMLKAETNRRPLVGVAL